ncbi:hypothetical protein [Paenibacillus physcomitrellae]|uniref:Uncharacterized protein n=1 Tax=Paenibacillus physcomitrellae TaxID=1619311 RepID=A0ABQ1GG67_9BACL|nr:hypothetical protein [Paenibacillus physcomitrellae]GGA43188.1 hypothetical protein GCM10010917_30610 [Paenibacillus physcomitrellae]
MRKAELWRKEEDVIARDYFIRDYIDERFEATHMIYKDSLLEVIYTTDM